MVKKLRSFAAILLGVLIFSGCAKYKPHSLSIPEVAVVSQDNKKETVVLTDDLNKIVELDEDDLRNVKIKQIKADDVNVEARALDEADCRYYFSRKIVSKGYRPVQLFIKNNSTEKYVLDTSTINLPLEYRDKMAERLHLDMVPRALGWGLAGVFCVPFFIPAVVECINVPKVNKALDEDFDRRVINANSKYEIRPGGVFNKVFFVKDDEFENKLKFKLLACKSDSVKNIGLIL